MATKQTALEGWGILKYTFLEFSKDECPRKAAALSYYTIFSLPPLLVIIIITAGLVLSPDEIAGWIQGQVGSLIGTEAASQIQTMVEGAQAQVEGGFSIGLVLGIAGLLFGATGTFAELQLSLKAAWRDVWVGAFVTAVLFVLGKFLIGLYIGRSNPGEVYGAAAALALILIWVYYSSMILFLGAEFTQVWAQRHGKGIQAETGAMRVIKQEKIIREPEQQALATPAPQR